MLLWRKFEDKLAALYIQQKEVFFICTMAKRQSQDIACNGFDKR
jgi:hypothetical protein